MYFVRSLRFDDQFPDALLLSIPNQRSVLFFNAPQNVRRIWPPAAIWKYRVCECELRQGHLTASQKCSRIWAKRGADARRGAKLQHSIEPRVQSDADASSDLCFHQR